MLPTLLSTCALVVAAIALVRSRSQSGAGDEAARDARRAMDSKLGELEERVAGQTRWLGMLASGEPLTPAMIEDGQFFHDVDPQAGEHLVRERGATWLDVRTPAETAAGVIPGATWIPMDQLQERLDEIPRDRPLVVY